MGFGLLSKLKFQLKFQLKYGSLRMRKGQPWTTQGQRMAQNTPTMKALPIDQIPWSIQQEAIASREIFGQHQDRTAEQFGRDHEVKTFFSAPECGLAIYYQKFLIDQNGEKDQPTVDLCIENKEDWMRNHGEQGLRDFYEAVMTKGHPAHYRFVALKK